jgi:hypothetical protein
VGESNRANSGLPVPGPVNLKRPEAAACCKFAECARSDVPIRKKSNAETPPKRHDAAWHNGTLVCAFQFKPRSAFRTSRIYGPPRPLARWLIKSASVSVPTSPGRHQGPRPFARFRVSATVLLVCRRQLKLEPAAAAPRLRVGLGVRPDSIAPLRVSRSH